MAPVRRCRLRIERASSSRPAFHRATLHPHCRTLQRPALRRRRRTHHRSLQGARHEHGRGHCRDFAWALSSAVRSRETPIADRKLRHHPAIAVGDASRKNCRQLVHRSNCLRADPPQIFSLQVAFIGIVLKLRLSCASSRCSRRLPRFSLRSAWTLKLWASATNVTSRRVPARNLWSSIRACRTRLRLRKSTPSFASTYTAGKVCTPSTPRCWRHWPRISSSLRTCAMFAPPLPTISLRPSPVSTGAPKFFASIRRIWATSGATFFGWEKNPAAVLRRKRCCKRSEERRVGKECRSRWSPY